MPILASPPISSPQSQGSDQDQQRHHCDWEDHVTTCGLLLQPCVLLGGAAAGNCRLVVQSAGHGFRIPLGILRDVMESERALRQLLLRYALSLNTQSAQTAACNRLRRVDQQVCRLLLMCLDRWASNRLSLTHERTANLLGVRREGVTGLVLIADAFPAKALIPLFGRAIGDHAELARHAHAGDRFGTSHIVAMLPGRITADHLALQGAHRNREWQRARTR